MKPLQQRLKETELLQERSHAARCMLRLFADVLDAAKGSAPVWLFVRMNCASTATCGVSLSTLVEGITGAPLVGSPWCKGVESPMIKRIETYLTATAPAVEDDPFEGEVLMGSNAVRRAAVWCNQMWAMALHSIVEDSEAPEDVCKCFEQYAIRLGYGTNRIEETTVLDHRHMLTTQQILASFKQHGRAHMGRRRGK